MIPKYRLCTLLTVLTVLSVITFSSGVAHATPGWTAGGMLESAAAIDNEGSLLVVGSSVPFSNGQSQAFFFKFVSSLPDSPSGQTACMRTFGNGEPLDTYGNGITTDSSDSIYITGPTQTFGGEDYDVFLQKYTSSCNLVYTLQWGGPGNDIPHGITVDATDNVYITGTTDSFGNGITQIFLLKYSPWGSLQFSQIWGSVGNSYGNGVATDNLGNVYVVGTSTSNVTVGSQIVLLKYDSSGNLLFQKTVGGTQNSYGTGVAVDSAGDVYETGYTYSLGPTPGISAVILLKYDPSGNLLYRTTWGGKQNDVATGIATDIDGNVYLTGYTKTYSVTSGVASAFLVKFNQAGNLAFQRVWGGNRGDFAYGVAVDSAENAYITGYTYSFGPNSQGANFFILQYDRSGNLQFEKLYGGGIPDT